MTEETMIIACARCGRRHTEREWSALSPIQEVAGEELAALVRGVRGRIVVVRACTCGRPIARLEGAR